MRLGRSQSAPDTDKERALVQRNVWHRSDNPTTGRPVDVMLTSTDDVLIRKGATRYVVVCSWDEWKALAKGAANNNES
jgi:hypothetical protein